MNTIRLFLLATFAALALAIAPSASAQATDAPAEGRDYVRIEGGLPFHGDARRIEVAEVFAYWCHHCHAFEPLVAQWKTRLPADVRFVQVPAAFDANDPFARATFAARRLKLPASVHDALFRAIHVDRSLSPNANAAALAQFHAGHGVDAARFLAEMDSPGVSTQMRWARKFAELSGVEGTPTLIVDGRYRVLGRSHQDAIRIADQLIAQLRAQRR